MNRPKSPSKSPLKAVAKSPLKTANNTPKKAHRPQLVPPPQVTHQPRPLKFITSAVSLQGCPNDSVPEVGIIGRSNAGKSTMINGISGSRVAQVSSTPGKTRLLNFFEAESYRLVDMPGYGFSSRSGDEQRSWQGMIEPYLSSRTNLIGLILVMDIRRDWSHDEENLLDWLEPSGIPACLVLTKADKMSRSEALKRRAILQLQSGLEDILVTSSLQKSGFRELEDLVYMKWVKPAKAARRKKPKEPAT